MWVKLASSCSTQVCRESSSEMKSSEHTEVCLLSQNVHSIYQKLLKVALRPSVFLLDSKEEDYSHEFRDLLFEQFRSRLNADQQKKRELCLTRNAKNSIIVAHSLYKILYLIHASNKPHDFPACSHASKIIPLYTGVSTLIRSVCACMHLVFILDMGSLLWFSELYDGVEYLLARVDEFLSSLERMLGGVLWVLERLGEEVEVRFSVFSFGTGREDGSSCFRLSFFEVPIGFWASETQVFRECLAREVGQILKTHGELFEEGGAGFSGCSWGHEVLGLLGSFSASLTHSLIVITSGVLSSRLFSERSAPSLICQSSYLIQYCQSNEIQVHFLVINRFDMDDEESEIGLIPSLDTLEFVASSCCGSTITICKAEVSEQDARRMAVDLLLRSDKCVGSLATAGVEPGGELAGMREVYSYKVSQRLSLMELLVNKLRNGFDFVGESSIGTPLALLSRFHKLVGVVCLVEETHNSEPWTLRYCIKDFGEPVSAAPYKLSLLKELLEAGEEGKKLSALDKPHRLAHLLYSFILKNRLLDAWTECLVEHGSSPSMGLVAFPRELNSLCLPSTIRHRIDLVLESDQTLFKETFDGFKESWELLQARLVEMGFKAFVLENLQDGYDFPAEEKDVLVYYNLSPKLGAKFDDFAAWRVLRSWANSAGAGHAKDCMIVWLVARRISIRTARQREGKSSLVKLNISYYGFSPLYCQEYTRRLKEQVAHFGVDSREADLSLLRFLLGTDNAFEGVLKGNRCLEKSWSYVLWSEKEKYGPQEQRPMDLNGRVILTISNSRQLEGWVLLNLINDKTQLNLTWYKVRDLDVRDSLSLKLAFIYDLTFQPGGSANSNKLTCRVLMASSVDSGDLLSEFQGGSSSFSRFAEGIQSQDNKIIQTISLIDYLYTSSHLRKDTEYLSNMSDEETAENVGEMGGSSGAKNEGFKRNMHKSKSGVGSSHSNGSLSGCLTKSKDFNKYKRIIQNKSFYGGTDKISLSMREISNLFLTYDNEEQRQGDFPPINVDDYCWTFEEQDKEHFISQFKPLCQIEIPLVSAESMLLSQHGSSGVRKGPEAETRRKYLEGAPEGSFGKFLYKLSKITDRSVRVDENEWYTVLFIDERDLDAGKPEEGLEESLVLREDLEPGSFGEPEGRASRRRQTIRRLHTNQNYDYMVITHIRLDRSSLTGRRSSTLGVYLCSYYNLSFGVTGKKVSLEMGSGERRKFAKARRFVELYISRVGEIWNSTKFKMISEYFLLGIPICFREIARIQNENELSDQKPRSDSGVGNPRSPCGSSDLDVDQELDLTKEESAGRDIFRSFLFGLSPEQRHLSEQGPSDPETCLETAPGVQGQDATRREVYRYLKCNVDRFRLGLLSFKIVLSRKFGPNLELARGFEELDKVARLIGEELESRMRSSLRVKLVSFDSQHLDCFLVFCGALGPHKSKNESVIVTVSLLRDGQGLGISYLELTRFWTGFGKSSDFAPGWFHFLVWRSLVERDDLELKATLFTSVDNQYVRVSRVNMELWSAIRQEKEAFASKLRSVLSSWIADMTMELSFIHGNEVWGQGRDEPRRMSLFACFGRELLLDCLKEVRERTWNGGQGLDSGPDSGPDSGGSFERGTQVAPGSLIFKRDIQFPLIKSTTKFGNDISLINLLSSQADYIPIKRNPHLVLIWHGSQFPMDGRHVSSVGPGLKSRLRRGFLEQLLDHVRVLAEISSPRGAASSGSVLGLALKIYFPSSLAGGVGTGRSQSKVRCRVCDFSVEQGNLRESINFLFSTMQSRFIDIWKEATCDFLLQNVTISRMASSLMVPKFVSADDAGLSTGEDGQNRRAGISVLDSSEQEHVFGTVSVASEWLYEVPFETSPAKFRMKKSGFGGLFKRRLDPEFYQEPGEVVLWDGRIIKVPNYIFWLEKHEEVFVEVPSGLYDAPLIDMLFGGGRWDISTIDRYSKQLSAVEKSLFGKESGQDSEMKSSPREIEFISLVYPKGWLLYSEDATTSTSTLGTGSLFLIKPDYLFIDVRSKEMKAQRKRRKDLIHQHESSGQGYSVELPPSGSSLSYVSRPRSKIGLSLSFFGKRKPSKYTKLYFYKQLKLALQRLISGWSSSSIGAAVVLPRMDCGSRTEEIYLGSRSELSSVSSGQRQEVPCHLTFVLKLSNVYQNFIAASISRVASQSNVVFRVGDLFAVLTSILTRYSIDYEEVDRGVRIFNRNIDIDSKSQQLEYRVDVSFFSGINGRVLDVSDPWVVGSASPGQDTCQDLESYVGDCLAPLFYDEIDPFPSPYWDFNKILEPIFLCRNSRADGSSGGNTAETSSWSLVRDSDGRLTRLQSQPPLVHLAQTGSVSGKESQQRQSASLSTPRPGELADARRSPPMYWMPCVYIGADTYYRERTSDLDDGRESEPGEESGRRANGIILFVNSLLNLVFMELLIRSKLTLKDNWVIRENSLDSRREPAASSSPDGYSASRDGDLLETHGVTIGDLHKYSDDVQNFFQVVINNRETIERFIPTKLASNPDTMMRYFPVPTLTAQDINGEGETVQMYFPSWSASELVKIIREEATMIERDKASQSGETNLIAVVSGYTCVIHDTKEINIDERILKKEDGISLANTSSISVRFPVGRLTIKDTDIRECGWHILKYKSRIRYLNSVHSRTDSDISAWVDSLYDMSRVSSGELSLPSIYGSFLNISGGRQRPCITANIHLNNGPVMDYMVFIEFTPSGIILVCWNVPQQMIGSIEEKIKRFVYLSSVRMIWSLQLSIWYKYESVYRRCIFVLDLSDFQIDLKKNLGPKDWEDSCMGNGQCYPRICKISTKLISHLWREDFEDSEVRWSSSSDLYKKELTVECRVNRLKLEDVVIPNIATGRILDLRFEDLSRRSQAKTELNWMVPSVLNKIRSLNSDELIARWDNWFFKYKLWVFVNQFLIEIFSIKSERQEVPRVLSKNIIRQVSKSNMVFKYHQIINFLKKRAEICSLERPKYHQGAVSGVSSARDEKSDSSTGREDGIQTHYDLLTYLQNSHSIISALISAATRSRDDHLALLHPDRLSREVGDARRSVRCESVSSCGLCATNPKDTSIRIILTALFRCSIDVLHRLHGEEPALAGGVDSSVASKERRCQEEIRVERVRCPDTKGGELVAFVQQVRGIPCQSLSSDLGSMFAMKDLSIQLDESLRSHGFIRVANSHGETVSKGCPFKNNYCVSVISSIYSGLGVHERVGTGNLSFLMETETGPEKEVAVYLKTVHIKRYDFSIPICLFMSLYQDKLKAVCLSCVSDDGDLSISSSLLEFIGLLRIERLVFGYVLSSSESLAFGIWERSNRSLRTGDLGRSGLRLSADKLIRSVTWLNDFLRDCPSIGDGSSLLTFRIWVSRSLRVSSSQLSSLKSSFCQYVDSGLFSHRISVVPNSRGVSMIIFLSLARDELVGVVIDDYRVGENGMDLETRGDSGGATTAAEREHSVSSSRLDSPMECFVLKGGYGELVGDEQWEPKFCKKEKVKWEVSSTLSSIQEFIRRDQMIQRIQVYGATCSHKFVEDLANNQFSVNLSLDIKLLKQLPVLTVRSLSTKNDVPKSTAGRSVVEAQEKINVITSLFLQFWRTEQDAIQFSNSLYSVQESGELGDFSQGRVISVVIRRCEEIILVRFFTTFRMTQGRDIEWTFNDVKFTFKDDDKIKRHFLIRRRGKEGAGLQEQTKSKLIKKDLFGLIFKSIDFILDSDISKSARHK